MQSIALPICKKPKIRTYLRQAFPLSVLFADGNTYYNDFILNNYIQLIADPNAENRLDYHDDHYRNWPCIKCNRIEASILKANNIDVIEFIINSLHEGYYVEIWSDHFYIPGKHMYMKEHLSHGLLIYGYILEECSFISLTYTDANQYGDLKAKQDNIVQSCSNEHFSHINLIKREDGAGISYNINKICKKFIHYLNASNYDIDDMKYRRETPYQFYGVRACKWFRDYIDQRPGNLEEPDIDLRLSYCFSEHKKCNGWRISVINETHSFKIPNIDEELKLLNSYADLVVMLSLKYNMKKDVALVGRIIENINSAIDLECRLMITVLEFVEKYKWQYIESNSKFSL